MSGKTIAWVLGAVALALGTDAGAQPSPNVNDYVLFATTAIKAKSVTVSNGDVGVNDAGGRLVAPRSFTGASSVVASDIVRFDKDPTKTVLQQLFANVVEQGGTGAMSFTTPIIGDVAGACGFPAPFPPCGPGLDVDVAVGTTTVLAPGTYGRVRVHGSSLSAGSLVLTGGTYVFCDVKASSNAQLRVQAPSTIDVLGRVTFGPGTYFGPDTGSGLVSSDIQLYAAGPLVKLTRSSFSKARICAPMGKIKLATGGTHVGVHVGASIRAESVTLDVGSPSGAF
jgi:hypothetical protein